jgi:L-ascorbate metabolism protein UlaG (beta-lactamase superfamily)
MKVTWFAHACFKLEGSGMTIVTDPYTPASAGIDPVATSDRADIVVMSSALDKEHSNWKMIPGEPRVINALDAVDEPIVLADNVELSAVATQEGFDRPDEPKANAMYVVRLDDVSVCHMGDAGQALTAAQIDRFAGEVDVLLALAGGKYTLSVDDLKAAVDAIQPRVVIPMHYKTPRVVWTEDEAGSLDHFLEVFSGTPVTYADGSSMTLDAPRLPAETSIVVLQPQYG